MSLLKTDYKDAELSPLMGGQRQYDITTNSSGYATLTDKSVYSQVGDTFGADDINATNEVANGLFTADGIQFFFDKKDGKYGFNTSASRGADTFVPFKSGGVTDIKADTFTTSPSQYGIVEVDCGFKPDIILVRLPFSNGDTFCIFWNKLKWANNKAMWVLYPTENNYYMPLFNRTNGETGVQAITDNGFTFKSNASNTRNVLCDYIAIKY